MKSLIIFLSILTSFYATAADKTSEQFMTVEEQMIELEDIAKGIRRNLWRSGHKDVDSATDFITKAILDENIADNDKVEDPLYDDEIAQLYKCHYSKSCELYQVGVNSVYMGGFGQIQYYVLLYTKTGKHFKISHVVYAE